MPRSPAGAGRTMVAASVAWAGAESEWMDTPPAPALTRDLPAAPAVAARAPVAALAALAAVTAVPMAATPARTAPLAATTTSAAPSPSFGALLCALAPALDLAEARPGGHAVRASWIGQQLGRAIGLPTRSLRAAWLTLLLKDLGGSQTGPEIHRLLAVDDLAFKQAWRTPAPPRPLAVALAWRGAGGLAALRLLARGRALAHRLADSRAAAGARLARALVPGEDVPAALATLDAHWDGRGTPAGLAGEDIPHLARVAALAQALDLAFVRGGPEAAMALARRQRGRAFDPALCDTMLALGQDVAFWRRLDDDELALALVAAEPAPQPLDDDALDAVARVFGQAADAKSRHTAGHSERVAQRADEIAARLGLDLAHRRWLRRAALLHDLGVLGVSTALLDATGPQDAAAREARNAHAALTETLLAGCPPLKALARIAGAHHERLDGAGYPRGLDARHLRLETRIIRCADRYDALVSGRAAHPARSADAALALMQGEVGSHIDADCLLALRAALAGPPR